MSKHKKHIIGPTMRKVLDHLKQNEAHRVDVNVTIVGKTATEVSTDLNITRHAAQNALHRLWGAGEVTHDKQYPQRYRVKVQGVTRGPKVGVVPASQLSSKSLAAKDYLDEPKAGGHGIKDMNFSGRNPILLGEAEVLPNESLDDQDAADERVHDALLKDEDQQRH